MLRKLCDPESGVCVAEAGVVVSSGATALDHGGWVWLFICMVFLYGELIGPLPTVSTGKIHLEFVKDGDLLLFIQVRGFAMVFSSR